MKLVEILARELKEWPEDCAVVEQAIDGDICAHRDSTKRNFRHLGISITLAEDWMMAFVTRAQWEAERTSIAAEEAPTWHIGTETEEWRAECQKQYEQELWDKVAASVYQMAFVEGFAGWDIAGFEYESGRAFLAADAFMAERAKRLKGVK